jgi:fumarate reductase subunit D
LMFGMFCWIILCVLGILLTFSLVKTDELFLIRICAFSSEFGNFVITLICCYL